MAPAAHVVRAAVLILLLSAATGACARSPDPASAEPSVAAVPLTPEEVERRLRTLDPDLSLVAPTADDDAGVFPDLAFQASTSAAEGIGASLHLVFIYPTIADRVAAQPMFNGNTIQGPSRTMTWDGDTHSTWIGVENVILEVVLPGGVFGGRSPTPVESGYPDRVREALVWIRRPE